MHMHALLPFVYVHVHSDFFLLLIFTYFSTVTGMFNWDASRAHTGTHTLYFFSYESTSLCLILAVGGMCWLNWSQYASNTHTHAHTRRNGGLCCYWISVCLWSRHHGLPGAACQEVMSPSLFRRISSLPLTRAKHKALGSLCLCNTQI